MATADNGNHDLRARIEAAVVDRGLVAGDRIGAERELADAWGVSRWAVRRAVDSLVADGAVIRVTNGRSGGIHVAPQRVFRDLDHLVGLPEYLRAQGVTSGTTVLASRVERASHDIARRLGLDDEAFVFQIDRVRVADGLPLSTERCFFPAAMFPGLLDMSLTQSLYGLLETEFGIRRGQATETITAVTADRDQAALLRVPSGSALLVVRRDARLEDGTPFEHSVELYRADRASMIVRATAGSTSMVVR